MLEAGTALAMQQGGVAQRDEPKPLVFHQRTLPFKSTSTVTLRMSTQE